MCRRASLTSWFPMVRPPWSSAVSSAITFSAIPTSSSVPLMSTARRGPPTGRGDAPRPFGYAHHSGRKEPGSPPRKGEAPAFEPSRVRLSSRPGPHSILRAMRGRLLAVPTVSQMLLLLSWQCQLKKDAIAHLNFNDLAEIRFEAEFLELHGIHRRRGTCHEALNPLRLREGDHLADRVGPRQQHDEAVEPEGDPPMGRGAEFEGLQEEPEPLPRLLRAEPKGIEHLLLSLPVVVSDAAATQLVAIDHEVVRLGPHRLGGALEQGEILVHGGGEGVVERYEPLFLLAVLQEGKIGDPDRTDKGLVYRPQPPPQLPPRAAEGPPHHGRVVADREEKVARHKLETPDQPFEG